jgi:hypothetical protein
METFNCDRCGEDHALEGAYGLVLEMTGPLVAACEPDDEPAADLIDAMDELLTEQVALEAVQGEDDAPLPAQGRHSYRLCRGCYAKVLANPLGDAPRGQPRFSLN